MIAASDAGRAMRHSRGHGAASSALVSRSRAMPVGDRRSSPRASSPLAMRDLAARRAAVPGFALPRDAGRRPPPGELASAPVPALVRGWRCAISLRVAQRCRVSRSPAMPTGGRRSSPRAFSPLAIRGLAARRAAVPGFALPRDAGRRPPPGELAGAPVPALFRGWRCAISLRVAQRCRVSRSRAMPVGDRRSSPRAFSRLAIRDLAARRAAVPGFALPRDAGRRPPPGELASAPVFRGWRYAISLRVEQRCRVSRSRAMPVGDRRSAFSWLAMRDLAARRAAVPGFALPRDAGRRPALQSASRFFAVGDARPRCASSSGAGFRAPARCRSETGAPPLFRGWRYAISLRVAQRCRVSRSRAMPVGDRRSFAVGDAPSGQLGSPGARGIRKKPS